MHNNQEIYSTNRLFRPTHDQLRRIVDIPDETGKRAGASQDWVPFYETYPKIKSVLPAKLKTEKDVQILNQCKSRGVEFKDPEFPHNLQPLVDPKGVLVHKDWDTLSWQSARTYFEGEKYYLFNGISPEDIGQQAIGDCYLLGAISCLATQPGLVTRLFDTDQINQYGVYSVWLNINGKWIQYVVDDYFPVNRQGAYVFTVPNKGQNEIWAMIIEKAYAKAYGGYYKIHSGILSEAFRDLTGAPPRLYKLDEAKSNLNKAEKIFSKIKNGFKRTYLVAGGTKPHPTIPEFKKPNGLIMGHAYSILDLDRVVRNGQEIRLVQLRNPWGKDEWNGDWSDTSNLWTQQERDRLEVYQHECNDGIFWMKFEDFLQEFNELHICKVDPTFTYNSIDVKFAKTGRLFQSVISINVTKAGKYTFSADRKDRHYYREIITLLSLNRLVLGKVTPEGIEFVKAECDCFRNTYIRAELTPGRYIAMVEIEYSEKTKVILDQQRESRYQSWRDICFSCYGPSICDLEHLDSDKLDQICDQSFNKLQYDLIKDMFLHKPKDFHKYGVEKLGNNQFHIKMKDGTMSGIHFEQYQLLDLMVVVLSNNNSNGIAFQQHIQKINGYELICDQGIVSNGGVNWISIGSGQRQVFILRFVDGEKEYLPDFK